MRILSVHNRYRYRGGEDECFDIEQALLRQHGHEVCEYVQDSADVAQPSGYAAVRTGLELVWSHRQYKALRLMIRGQRPDVMHVHNFFPLISPAVHYAGSAEGVPVVQTLHNYRLICPGATLYRDGQICTTCVQKRIHWPAVQNACYRDSRAASGAVALMDTVHQALRTWHSQVTCFITPSDFARHKFIQAGFPEQRLVTKPNCVHPEPAFCDGKRTYAAFVGRLSPEKGITTMLSAWKLLKDRIPLKIVGDGPMAAEVAAFAQKMPCVEYLGRRSLEETYKIMAGAKFVVVPSEWYETFGRVVVEAFACGTPVIGANLGAIPELVADYRTGLLFTAGNANDLAGTIDWANTHPHAVAGMGRNARLEYEGKYTAGRNYELLMNIYRKAIDPSCRFPGEQCSANATGLGKEVVA